MFNNFNFNNPFNSLNSSINTNFSNLNLSATKSINLPSSNFANAIKQNLAFAEYCFNTTFDGVERFVGLNISTARNALEVALSSLNGIIGDKNSNPQVMVFLHPALESSVKYTRKALEISRETKSKLSEKFEQELQTTSEKMGRFVERSFAYAPIGGKTATTAIKSAIKMANDTFGGLSKASEKINEVAQANVNATVVATSKTLNKIGIGGNLSTKSIAEEVEIAENNNSNLNALVSVEEDKKISKRGKKSTNN